MNLITLHVRKLRPILCSLFEQQFHASSKSVDLNVVVILFCSFSKIVFMIETPRNNRRRMYNIHCRQLDLCSECEALEDQTQTSYNFFFKKWKINRQKVTSLVQNPLK